MGFFRFVSTVGIADFSSSSSSCPVSTSARDSPTGSMSSPMGTATRFRVVVGFTNALLCHTRFPTVDSLSQNTARHLSHCGFLQTSLLGSDRNWEYHSQDKLERPFHKRSTISQMNSHSLTNFTVSRNHVTTIVSHIEVLLFFARDPRSS